MRSLLLIEDETQVINFMRKGLEEEGFKVTVALDGNSGIELATQNAYDIILLDIMLPDRNGIEVCKHLRMSNLQTPIVFLTALNTPDNIAHGLNAGADDYVVKPFKFNELFARINAVLRRSTGVNSEKIIRNVYEMADLVIDDDAKTVQRSGQSISLTATEYRLLVALVKNKSRVLSKSQLLDMVWDVTQDLNTNVVEVYINYLRKKLDSNSSHKLIHTVVGMGYKIQEA
jgi:two-component system, OmpR family, copper resistance phosphate regulon response regulator CusR